MLIAEDAALVRASLRMLLDAEPGIVVVGEAVDGVEAIEETRRLGPDVVLMDVGMPRLDGIEATAVICRDTATRIVVLTTFDDDECLFGALRAGASGFLLKSATPDELAEGIRRVAAGDALLAPEVTARVVAGAVAARSRPVAPPAGRASIPPAHDAIARVAALDERSRALLAAVGRGLSNAEIAAELGYAASTIKTYVSRLLAALDARDRAQLVVIAYEAGLVGG